MPSTIKDILTLNSFSGSRLIAGKEGVDRIVDSAAFMEVPDIFSYLQANTLLLTTLFPIANRKELLENFIPRLAECQVSGVCIKPHRYIDKIPEEMLTQANSLGIPLIELNADANLSNMANEVLSYSLNEYIIQMQYRNSVHLALTELLLKESNLDELTERLGDLIKQDVYILGKDMRCLCATEISKERDEAPPISNAFELDDLRKNKTRMLSDRHLYPIMAGKRRFGYIYVKSRPTHARDCENLDIAIEQAAMLFASFFLRTDAVAKNQKNFRDVFIRELLQGSIQSPLEIEKKLEAFSMTLKFPQPLVCIKAFSENVAAQRKFYDLAINSDLIDDEYTRFDSKDPQKKYLIYFNDSLIILGCTTTPEKLSDFFSSLVDKLQMFLPERNSRIGVSISDPSASAITLNTAYRQALSTLGVGAALSKHSFVEIYAQRRIFSIIEQVKNRKVLESFVNDKIGSILDYDAKNNTELLETLRLLIEGDLSYKKAAEKSFLHYNTIRYRAAKIKQLGINLKSGRNFAEIVMAHDCWIWLQATDALE